ncbi:DEAD-box ATP-dependent RNA helicase 28-like isoform X2 [Vicia villosa]|uniref:DEAD-box ATP-dependent RNA helicase 28-like isoform X2 n=1 Tax=Vicia villosa TaxID=3911 RepID=UPI00273CC573|nr:DEAD-box ATP-dependent RNA helicase 28-like isoform X2 [Vicia villosa]
MDKENGSSQKAEDLKLKEKRKREREKNMPRKKLRKLEAAREMLEKPQQKSIKSRKNSFSRTEEMWELFQTDMKDKKSKQRGSGVGKKPQKSFKSKSRDRLKLFKNARD